MGYTINNYRYRIYYGNRKYTINNYRYRIYYGNRKYTINNSTANPIRRWFFSIANSSSRTSRRIYWSTSMPIRKSPGDIV
jgi:hypothetical protein